MKDTAHHLRSVQRKVIRENRKNWERSNNKSNHTAVLAWEEMASQRGKQSQRVEIRT